MPKILSLKQLLQKKYKYLDGVPEEITQSFGDLVQGFVMEIWGESGNGKSRLTMSLLSILLKCLDKGKALYIGLEEGHRRSMQKLAEESLQLEMHQGLIGFADHQMTYDETIKVLKRKKSAKIVVIDSIQYWDITYELYKVMKETFPNKIIIFLSHAKGKNPDGKIAEKVKYDADVKVYVEGYIAFIRSRLGGNKPYVIWEDGAKAYWGKDFRSKSAGIKAHAKKATKSKKVKETAVADEVNENEVNAVSNEQV